MCKSFFLFGSILQWSSFLLCLFFDALMSKGFGGSGVTIPESAPSLSHALATAGHDNFLVVELQGIDRTRLNLNDLYDALLDCTTHAGVLATQREPLAQNRHLAGARFSGHTNGTRPRRGGCVG